MKNEKSRSAVAKQLMEEFGVCDRDAGKQVGIHARSAWAATHRDCPEARPKIDTKKIKIESNIPLPKGYIPYVPGNFLDLLKRMKLMDSVVLPIGTAHDFQTFVRKLGGRIVTETIKKSWKNGTKNKNGKSRCWLYKPVDDLKRFKNLEKAFNL